MNRNIEEKILKEAFQRYQETIWVYFKATNSLGSNYDPYRKIDKSTTLDTPYAIKAVIHQTSPSGLVAKELGLASVGSIVAVVKDSDVESLKNGSKIIYKDEEYTAYNKAVGNKFQVYSRPFGFSRVILFKVG